MATDPATAINTGIMNSGDGRLFSKINANAVNGTRNDVARNAAAPNSANAPNGAPGHHADQTLPSTMANNAPLHKPGVSSPPAAPARRLVHVISTRSTGSAAANSSVSEPSN